MEDRYLFRGKRIDNGEWAVGLPSYNKDGQVGEIEVHGDTDVTFRIVDTSTICQCTGLKDKNGKLIWENDIVDFLGHKGTIVFECGSFGIAYKAPIDWNGIETNILPITGCENRLYACGNDNYISLWEIYWNFNDEDNSLNTVEVVGNALDNPEFLKEFCTGTYDWDEFVEAWNGRANDGKTD